MTAVGEWHAGSLDRQGKAEAEAPYTHTTEG
jgi:hypothetical protein